MGRPKGSKNKPKYDPYKAANAGAAAVISNLPIPEYEKINGKIVQVKMGFEKTEKVFDDAVKAAVKIKKPRKPVAEPLTKEALAAERVAPISPREVAQLRAEAKANTPKEGHAEAVVARAIEEVIKPNWDRTSQDAAGLKHFLVNAQRHGESVSMDKEKWDFALKAAGLRGQLTASKPEAGQDLEAKTVNRWRVMIG